MKLLEIILRLIDQLLTTIKFRKAQNDREKLEENPAAFFNDHFGSSMQSSKDKTNKTDSSNNA